MRSLTTPRAVIAVAGLGALSLALPPASLLSSAAFGLVTLRLGLRPSARVLGISLIAFSLLGLAFGGAWAPTVFYGLVLWLPIWAAGLLLRTTANLALTLEAAAVVTMLAVGLFYLLVDEPALFWQQTMEQVLRPMLEHAPPGIDEAQMHKGLELASRYLSGVAASGALFGLIAELLLARWVQAKWFNPGGFRAEFIALRLHRPVALVGLGTLAAGLAASGGLAELAWNLVIPLSVLCLFAGLAVVHALAAGWNPFWLTGVYIALFILPQITAVLALLGLSDPLLDWRRRFSGQSAR